MNWKLFAFFKLKRLSVRDNTVSCKNFTQAKQILASSLTLLVYILYSNLYISSC